MFFDVQFVDSITYFYHDLSMGWDSSWEQFANRQRNIWMSQHSHQWFKLHTQIVLFELSWFQVSIFHIYSPWSGQIIDDDYYHYGRAAWALKHFLNNECYFLVPKTRWTPNRSTFKRNEMKWRNEMEKMWKMKT